MLHAASHDSANIVQILIFLHHHLFILQQLYQIQPVTMPAGQELTQTMFIQSTNQTADAQVTQVSTDWAPPPRSKPLSTRNMLNSPWDAAPAASTFHSRFRITVILSTAFWNEGPNLS